MDLSKDVVKKIIGIVAFAIFLFVGLQNISKVISSLKIILSICSPFLIGAFIAFVLNVPLRFIEREIFTDNIKNNYKLSEKLQRPASLVITILLVVGVVFVVMFLIIPELVHTFGTLKDTIPNSIIQIQSWAENWVVEFPEISNWVMNLRIDWDKLGKTIFDFLQRGAGDFLTSTVGVATSIVSGIIKVSIGFVFSIYILLQKEKLGRQSKKILYSFLPEEKADQIISICSLCNKTFSNFLSGQCIEAVILGALFFITMTVFSFPYALVISILVGFTALVPIFGSFIGFIVGGFLILMVNPTKALWFIVLFLTLQQIEGNIIYPRVVGNSVGLPSIWVLVAVTIGGSTMGVLGMLVNIPLFSVIYSLIRESVLKRLEERKIAEEKIH